MEVAANVLLIPIAMPRWHSIPEPTTNKYYVVLRNHAFVRGMDIAIGMRSILAVRFVLEHCDSNQRTTTAWYGEVSGLDLCLPQEMAGPAASTQFCIPFMPGWRHYAFAPSQDIEPQPAISSRILRSRVYHL